MKIATLGSHTALNILRGAKDEGFETLLFSTHDREYYERFNIADKIVYVNDMSEFLHHDSTYLNEDIIIVPHGSFISYLSLDHIENNFKTPLFGNKYLFKWESDRDLEREWLQGSGIKIPEVFEDPDDIDRPVIVKAFGAKGGMGYFVANDKEDFLKKADNKKEKFQIQEYIVGVPMYFHFFYSPLNKELELLSVDRRYESNVDSLGRIPSKDQVKLDITPSYTVVGNYPIVIRESLLGQVFEIGEKVIQRAKRIDGRGLIGPFCLETICTADLEIITFEISARIVAGTNPFIPSSPYTYIKYGKEISCGRRIAMEIKQALESDSIEEIIT